MKIYYGSPFAMRGLTGVVTTNHALDASNDRSVWVFAADASFTADAIGFRQASLLGTSPTYRASIQTVDIDGNDTGTILGSGTFTSTSAANSTIVAPSISATTITRGGIYAVVIDHSGGTINSSNRLSVTGNLVNLNLAQFPRFDTVELGARTRGNTSANFGVRDTLGNWHGLLASIVGNLNADSSTFTGMRFKFPGTGTFKVIGIRFHGTINIGTTFDMQVRASDNTTLLQTQNVGYTLAASALSGIHEFYFGSTVATLTRGTSYTLVLAPGVDGSLSVYYMGSTLAATLTALPGGTDIHHTSIVSGVTTDELGNRPVIDLIIDEITDGSGSSGGVSASRIFGNC